jgi:hypothetical protein
MKQAAPIPDTSKLPKRPKSKEYDAVYRVWKQMKDEEIPQLPWRIFQQKFQQAVAQFPKLFTEIRHNRPQITQEDLYKWVQQQAESSLEKYPVTYDRYRDPETSYRDVEQLVLQLNEGADAKQIIGRDQQLRQYLDFVGMSSGFSGHPADKGTVGWLRVDFVNADWLFVDEVQSDLVNSITQAIAMATTTFEAWWAEQNAGVREKAETLAAGHGMSVSQAWNGSKQQLQRGGYTPEKLGQIKDKLVELFEDWSEYALATILEIARSHKITNVAINSSESIAKRDPSVDAPKLKMYYDNLAKGFGFKKQNVQTPEIKGTFWVRKASLRSYLTQS